MPPQNPYINSRADFAPVVRDALAMVQKQIKENPGFDVFDEIEIQLDSMLRWTADGREPTDDEKSRISIGLLAVRNLEPAQTDEIYAITDRLHSIQYVFRHWAEYD